jgi:diguanylate cyclase (GGDEF)-like protein/PAS domain S-box-containing protein
MAATESEISRPICKNTGQVTAEVGAVHDYAAIFEHAPVGLVEMDSAGRILRANGCLGALLGCAPQSLTGRALSSLVDPGHRATSETRLREVLTEDCDNCRFETQLVAENGALRWVEITAKVLPAGDQCRQAMLAVIRDAGEGEAGARRIETMLQASPAVIYTMDPGDIAGTMTYLSRNVATVTGWDHETIVGDPHWLEKHVFPEDYALCVDLIQNWLTQGAEGFCYLQYRQRKASGEWQWLEDQLSAVRDSEGRIIELVGAFQDVSAQVESEQRLAKVTRSLPGAIFQSRLYPDGRAEFLYASEGFNRVLGIPSEQLLRDYEAPFALIHPEDLDQVLASIEDANRDGQPWQARFRVRHPLRGWIWILGRSTSEALPDGGLLSHGVLIDITERMRAIEALRSRELELAEAQRIAHIGSWVWDNAHNTAHWSDEVYRIFGLDRDQQGGAYTTFMQAVHPDDRERLQAAVDAALAGAEYDIVHRIIRPDGGERMVHEQGSVVYDTDGHVLRMIGTIQDITDQQALEDSLRRLVAIIESTPDLVAMQGPKGEVQFVNAAGRRLLGLPEASGDPWQPGSGWNIEGLPREASSLEETIQRAHPAWAAEKIHRQGLPAAMRDGVWVGESALLDGAGREVPVSQVIIVHNDEQGHVRQISTIMRDISELKTVLRELKQSNGTLKRLAFYDRLTNVANRRYFENLLDIELHRADRYGTDFALIMFDLDHFKAVNDNYGHAIGDAVLREVASVVVERLRESDVLGRWGGEEFMILLPGDGPQQTAQVAEDVRERVAGHLFPDVGQVTVSLGIAAYLPGESRTEFLRRVDDALYRAKREGRNRVAVAEISVQV